MYKRPFSMPNSTPTSRLMTLADQIKVEQAQEISRKNRYVHEAFEILLGALARAERRIQQLEDRGQG
jgi:hypothetical protein